MDSLSRSQIYGQSQQEAKIGGLVYTLWRNKVFQVSHIKQCYNKSNPFLQIRRIEEIIKR